MIFVISLILIGAVAVNGMLHADNPLPQTWIDNSNASHLDDPIDPFSIASAVTPAATLFGLVTGAVWLRARGGYVQKKDIKHILLYFFTGLIVALLIKEGLGFVFPKTADILGFSLRYIRYALMGFWLIGLAPALFIKLGWAEKES